MNSCLIEEISCYPDFAEIMPFLIAFPGLLEIPENRLEPTLNKLFSSMKAINKENEWLDSRDSILEGILSLVPNYLPKNKNYTSKEIREFVETVIWQQLGMRYPDFAKSCIQQNNMINMNAFPSLKMSLYTVFYKFYVENRTPIKSDTFDILISAPTPYVDIVITERHQAEVIKKIQRVDTFLSHVEPLTLKDIR